MTSTMIVDDETDMRLLVRLALDLSRTELHVVAEAVDGVDALSVLDSLVEPDPEVIVLDNRMPNMSGLDAAREILRRRPDQIMVLYSAYLDASTRAEAAEIGISACIAKDEIETVAERIAELVEARGSQAIA